MSKNRSKDLKNYPQISRRVRDTLARLDLFVFTANRLTLRAHKPTRCSRLAFRLPGSRDFCRRRTLPQMAAASEKPPRVLSKPITFATAGLGGILGWLVVHPANTCAVRMNLLAGTLPQVRPVPHARTRTVQPRS